MPVRTAQGKQDITVRWPTDEEWSQHRKRRRILQRQLGRGAVENDLDSAAADSKLYEAVRLNGAPPLTAAEAGFVVNQISVATVLNVELAAQDATVTLRTVMGETSHVLRMPTMDQVKKLQDATRVITLPYSLQEIRPNTDAAGALYDQLAGGAEGYAGAVPLIHKDVVVRAVISAIEQETQPNNDEGNF